MAREIGLRVYVDWDNDGDFGDANEDVTQYLLDVTGPSRGRASVYDEFGPGSLSIVLDNRSQLFSPYNESSALVAAGSLVPGRAVKFDVAKDTGTRTLFYGYTSSFVQPRRLYDHPGVQISAIDGFEKLRRTKIRIPLYENKYVHELIEAILDQANWPADLRDIDTSETLIPFFYQPEQSALTMLKLAQKQELGGQLFMSKDGKVAFRNREARAISQSLYTFYRLTSFGLELREEDLFDRIEHTRGRYQLDADISPVYVMRNTGMKLNFGDNWLDVPFSYPAKSVVIPAVDPLLTENITTLNGAINSSVTEFAVVNGSLLVPGTVIRIDAEWMLITGKNGVNRVKVTRDYDASPGAASHGNGATVERLTLPVNTDYKANAVADGTGTDLTSALSVKSFQADSDSAKLNLYCGETLGAYLMFFQVRGYALRESEENALITVEVTSPIVKDAPLQEQFVFNNDEAAVRAYANLRASIAEKPLPRPPVEIVPTTSEEMNAVLDLELGSRITLQNLAGRDPINLNDDFFVESLDYDWTIGKGQKPMRLARVRLKTFHHDLSEANLFRISGDIGAPNAEQTVAYHTGGPGTLASWSTFVSDSNLMYVAIAHDSTSDVVTSVTRNGQGFNLVEKQQLPSNGFWMYLFQLDNPDVGTFDVEVNTSESVTVRGGSIAYINSQTGVVSKNTGDDNLPTISIDLGGSNERGLAFIAMPVSTLFAPGSGVSQLWDTEQSNSANSSVCHFAGVKSVAPVSVISATAGLSQPWAVIGVQLKRLQGSGEYSKIITDVATTGARIAHA